MEHPKLLSIVLPNNKQMPFSGEKSEKIVNLVQEANFKGTVKNNELSSLENPLWKLEKDKAGHYKITHMLGYHDTSLSISLLTQPGSFNIIEHGPICFQIETVLDGESKDLDFIFTITRAISPQA